MFTCGCLGLCLALTLFPALQAEVTSLAHLQATLGLPIMMGCNLTLRPEEDLKQVRWLDVHNKTILHYRPMIPGSLTRQDGVDLVNQQTQTSVITIRRTKQGDEGCYTCIFDVYPTGPQQGKTCLFVIAKVESVGNKTAVRGKTTTLSCTYALADRVQQVLWKKTTEQGDTSTVASYTKRGSSAVETPFQERVKLSRTLGHSQLVIYPVQTEDEGCYTCEFHTYPTGSRSLTACLTVYVLPSPEVSQVLLENNVVQANCTAESRPPAELIWNVEGHNLTLGPVDISFEQRGDGTTQVISTILLLSRLLDEEVVTCTAFHRGLETSVSVTLNKTRNSHIILLSVGCVLLILLICLCVCMKRC